MHMPMLASESLRGQGFMKVLDIPENIGGVVHNIERGVPLTWDTNNGVTVVYDERGKPWVRRGTFEIAGGFTRGAHVPMSNDGGAAMGRLFPQ